VSVMLRVCRFCRRRRCTSWSALCRLRRKAHIRSHLLVAVLLLPGTHEGRARLQGLEHPRDLGMGSLVAAGGLAGAAFWLPVYPVRPTAPLTRAARASSRTCVRTRATSPSSRAV